MKWTIDKSFDFCYGHRVWSQELNTDYTGAEGACLACRHLHGHQGKIKVFLERLDQELTPNSGMVTDFKHLGWFKTWVDDNLDHKFIMDINDPLFQHECPEFKHESSWIKHPEGHWTPDMSKLPADTPLFLIEKYEGMVFVDFVPTSENICAWMMKVTKEQMNKLNIIVSAIEFWETPKSHCRVES